MIFSVVKVQISSPIFPHHFKKNIGKSRVFSVFLVQIKNAVPCNKVTAINFNQ